VEQTRQSTNMNQFYETTTKGNPQRITLNQHVIPRRYIEAFTDDNDLVEVLCVDNNIKFKANPQSTVFCAKRVWDQKAENGWMKDIEDTFHRAVSVYFNEDVPIPNQIATDFFLLWHIRSILAKNPPQPGKIVGISPEDFAKEQAEILERKGYIYIDKEQTLKSRFIASIQARIQLDRLRQEHANIVWSLAISLRRPFLISKHCPQYRYLPLNANTALFGNSHSRECPPEYTLQMNKCILDDEEQIVFSRSINDALG
jgi:hypothetical protein